MILKKILFLIFIEKKSYHCMEHTPRWYFSGQQFLFSVIKKHMLIILLKKLQGAKVLKKL